MSLILNHTSLLWLIGILQPVSVQEFIAYLKSSFGSETPLPSEKAIEDFFSEQVTAQKIMKIRKNPDIFSLTYLGGEDFPREYRMARDKARIYLLKKSRQNSLKGSREALATRLGGDALSMNTRPTIKGAAPNKAGFGADTATRIHPYWTRVARQFNYGTGDLQTSRGTHQYLHLVSFDDKEQLGIARHKYYTHPDKITLDYTNLALILGVSPKLISAICYDSSEHYRAFKIKKRGGKKRQIESPRVFLKVIQWFLNDYILHDLPQHHCVHSFRNGRSIISNAKVHVGNKFVANFDIENFFGSITSKMVFDHLIRNEFSRDDANTISKICCNHGVLPQGAPTSPIISNSILFGFDGFMEEICTKTNLCYSRYADDITISGDDKDQITAIISSAENFLHKIHGLSLNPEKTRIASKSGQQKVTGIVVNEGVRPPRKFRRKVRAIFHNAAKVGEIDMKESNRLRGYLSYLAAFPDIRDSGEVNKYREILATLNISKK